MGPYENKNSVQFYSKCKQKEGNDEKTRKKQTNLELDILHLQRKAFVQHLSSTLGQSDAQRTDGLTHGRRGCHHNIISFLSYN